MSAFGILRVQKIKSRSELVGRTSHNLRSAPTLNADSTKSNHDLRPDLSGSILERWDAVYQSHGRPKHRHDAVLALEVLQTFSAEAAGGISPEAWGAACLSFNERVFGADNILSAVLHLDEKTPHVHTLIVPFYAGKLSAAHWIDGPQKCRALQNSFFTEVAAGFGLERGQIGSNRKHIPQKLLYRTSNELQALAEKSIKQLGTAAVEPLRIDLPDMSVGLLTQNGRAEFQKTILTQVHRHWNALIKREREQIHTLLQPLIELTKQSRLQADALLQIESRIQLAMKRETIALSALKNESAHLRDIPLFQVAQKILGFEGRREGQSFVWESDAHKIVVTGQKFRDFKQDQRGLGGGAIDLVMHLLACDYRQAIQILAADFGTALHGAIRSRSLTAARQDAQEALSNPRRITFTELLAKYGARCDSTLGKVRDYLIVKRCIPAPLVDSVINQENLWANRWGSCVFGHRTIDGVLAGCSIRATEGDFKQTLGNKSAAWFSVGGSLADAASIVLTESPIDALSYAALEGINGRVIVSTAGAAEFEGLLGLRRPLVLAQDRDDAGEQQAGACLSQAKIIALACERYAPPAPAKDWNEFLTQITHAHITAPRDSGATHCRIGEGESRAPRLEKGNAGTVHRIFRF